MKSDSRDTTRSNTNDSTGKLDHSSHATTDDSNVTQGPSSRSHSPPGDHKEQHHSMLELKRFFRPAKKSNTPSVSHTNLSNSRQANASSATLSNLTSVKHDPFDDDGALVQKYGRLGKVLGSGVGGSVRLLVRPSDGVTFAVKEFRPRRPNEDEKDYAKKCTAEFCIGSTLHHPNIIQTLDIAHEHGHYYEVMEYCPVDFFAVVMSGKMLRSEINCCFRQICEGVKYLHGMGIAHRDLKLDNCVITADGIVKIIDFGSAVVFRYPFEDQLVKAHGVCGSDPYLAPETLTQQKYDAEPVDIWSIAIIYCCMTLKRFPWKAPKQSDPSFKLYSLADDHPHDYAQAAGAHKELLRRRREERKLKQNNETHITQSLKNTHVDEIMENGTMHLIEDGQDKKTQGATDKTTHSNGDKKNHSNEDYQEKMTYSSESAKDKTLHLHPNDAIADCSSSSQHNTPAKPSSSANLSSNSLKKTSSSASVPHHHQINGPYRLMRLLPHASRPIISKMLAINPRDRATFVDIFSDDWFREIVPCTVNSKGKTIHAPGHIHTEVREEDAHLESYKGK